jgi:hypothetical protein
VLAMCECAVAYRRLETQQTLIPFRGRQFIVLDEPHQMSLAFDIGVPLPPFRVLRGSNNPCDVCNVIEDIFHLMECGPLDIERDGTENEDFRLLVYLFMITMNVEY